MADLCLGAIEQLRSYLLAGDGINAELRTIADRDGVYLEPLEERNILLHHASAKLADANEPVVYPLLYLYCDRMENLQLEKFRRFSGRIRAVAELRVSAERFLELERSLARYVEATAEVLGNHHGKWTDYASFGGAYKVFFREIEAGGKNFLQAARMEIELQAHD